MKIRNVLNKEFANACEWFVDNKLSIHIRGAKTKSFLFLKLNMTCDTNRIKQFACSRIPWLLSGR